MDLSLTATGYATTNQSGVYHRAKDLRGVERLHDLAVWLHGLAFDLAPDLAVIEGYSFGSKGSAIYGVAEWGGVARLTLYDSGIPTVEIPPGVLKKYATGKGNATKPDMRMELYKRSGVDVADDNRVDALWLLAAASEAYDEGLWPMPKDRLAVLGKIDWPLIEKALA